MNQLKVKKLSPEAIVPTRAYSTDCGLDIYSLEDQTVLPFEGHKFSTGIAAEFPPNVMGYLTDRSSMAKRGFKLAGGVIDPHFTGELCVVLRNLSKEPLLVKKGDRIAQLVIIPIFTPEVFEVGKLSDSVRGSNGFGSSGR